MIKKIDFLLATLKYRDIELTEYHQIMQLKGNSNMYVLNTLKNKKLLKIVVTLQGDIIIKKYK